MRKERLLVYDRTCTGAKYRPGLSHSWIAGWWLYRAMGRLDACIGVDNWEAGLQWLATRPGPIAEIQYWGHGKWGELFVAQDRLDIDSLAANAPMAELLSSIAKKLSPESLVWFRTCETFGAVKGQRFAAACADRLGSRIAGHTFIIGPWQSGLHTITPGSSPQWPNDEGLALGTPQDPIEAHWSARRAPNTIHCLQGHVPSGY